MMVRMKTLFFRESDCGAYDFAARKNGRRKEKHAKGRSPFRDSPARVSTEMRVFFRAVRCRGRRAEETRKKRFDPHPARFDRAGFGAASTPRRV
jgi:hypothetical protein